MKEDQRKFIEGLGLAKTENDSFMFDLGGATGSVATSIALKNPIITSALYFLAGQQNLYEETLENTEDKDRAKKLSYTLATLTGAIEYIGDFNLLKGLKANNVIKSIVNGALSEGFEEGTQNIIEDVGMVSFGGRDKEINKILEDTVYASLLGAIGGAGGAGIGSIIETQKQKLREKGLNEEEINKQMDKVINILNDEELQDETINFLHRENDNTTWEGGNLFEATNKVKERASKITPDMFEEIEKIETEIEKEDYNKIRNQYKETLKNTLTEEQAETELKILDTIITNGAMTFGENPMARIMFLKENPLNLEHVDRTRDTETVNNTVRKDEKLFQKEDIIDLTKEFDYIKSTDKYIVAKEVENTLNKLINQELETKTEPLKIKIIEKNKGHIVRSNLKLNKGQQIKHDTALINIENIINNSIFNREADVDLSHNTRKRTINKKRELEKYRYFTTNIRINEQGYKVELATEVNKNSKDKNISDLYNVKVKIEPSYETQRSSLKSDSIYQNYNNNNFKNQDILQQTQPIIKGQYSTTDNLITLFETADPTTFLHEAMHWWEQTIRHYAKNGSKEAQKHLNLLGEYVGSKDSKWTREQKELLANSFEKYLYNGIAPTSKLKETFEKLKEWFKNIIKSFNNYLNPELKNYFDSLLSGKNIDNLSLDKKINDLETAINNDIDILYQEGYSQREINSIIRDKYKERLDKIRNEIDNSHNNLGEEYYKQLDDINYNVKTKSHKIKDWAYDTFINTDQQIRDISEDVYFKLKKFEASLNYNRNNYLNIVDEFNKKMIDLSKKDIKDFKILDAALKNGDMTKLKELLNKYNMNKEYLDTRTMLDEIRDKAIDVGIDVGYIKNYFPRQLNPKTRDDFLEMLRSNKDTQQLYNEIEHNIKQLQREGRMPYSDEDIYRIEFLNNYLRGYVPKNLLPLTAYSNLKKSRKINILKPEYMPYYKYSPDALRDYVFNALSNIEQRRFLGQDTLDLKAIRKKFKLKERQIKKLQETEAGKIKNNVILRIQTRKFSLERKVGFIKDAELKNKVQNIINSLDKSAKFFEKLKPETVKKIRLKDVEKQKLQAIIDTTETNLEDSIGEFLNNLLKDSKINTKDFNLLKRNIFNTLQPAITGTATKFMSSSSSVAFLNNVSTTLKQLLDTTISMYRNGFFNTMGGFYDTITKKGIRAKDLGIDKDIAAFTRQDDIGKFAEKVLKLTFFDKMDIFSKNININASLRRLKQDLKSNNAVVNKEIEMIFGDKAESVKKDILNETVNEDVLAYIFIKLSEVQPITMSSRTPFFLQNGNIRWAYIFKQYILKQLSLFKNDIYNNLRRGNIKEGLNNLLRLQLFITMGDLSALGIKELFNTLFGIEDDEEDNNKIADTLLNSILIFKIFNLYNVKQLLRGQVKEAMLYNQITPPIFSAVDNVAKDIKKAVKGDLDISNSRAIRNLPYGKDIQNIVEVINE